MKKAENAPLLPVPVWKKASFRLGSSAMGHKITVALGQAISRPGNLEGNLELAEKWAKAAAAAGAQLFCLPELFDTGYDVKESAERGPAPETMALGDLAINHRLHVLSGLASSEGGPLQNTLVHFGPDGSRHVYGKIHLFEAEPNVESRFFEKGARRALWAVEGIPVGPMICYDLRFPELARSLSLDGARILAVSSAWPASRREVFRILSQARAIENQCFVVSVNMTGRSRAGSFAGHSMVIAPDGKILAEAGEEETLLIAELNLAEVDKARNFLPCIQQRRPDCYRS